MLVAWDAKYGMTMMDWSLSGETTSVITFVKMRGAEEILNGRHTKDP